MSNQRPGFFNYWSTIILRHKITALLLAIAVLLVVISSILRIFTPAQIKISQTPTFTTNLDGSSSIYQGVTFTGEKITIDKNLPIARVLPSATSLDSVIQNIILTYNLTPSSQVPDLWEGKQGGLLTKDPYSNEYTFFFPPTASSGATLNQTQLVEIAQRSLNSIFPDLELQPIIKKAEHLPNTSEIGVGSDQSDKTNLLIPFAYVIKNIPIYFQKEYLMPFRITLNQNGALLTLRFTNSFYAITPAAEKKTINIDQAITNIGRGNASIISSFIDRPAEINLSQITSATLDQVELEYRFDPQNALVVPFYRFSGTIVNHDKTIIQANIITPAVETAAQN